MATNVKCYKRNNETEEKLIRRFLKKCKKERIVEEYRERSYYIPPSLKKRKKRERAERSRKREARKLLRKNRN